MARRSAAVDRLLKELRGDTVATTAPSKVTKAPADPPSKALLPTPRIAQLTLAPVHHSRVRPIKRLTVKHRRMVALYLMGHSYDEIARVMGCAGSTVGAVIRNPAVKPILEQAYSEAQSELRSLVPLSNEVIRQRLRAGDLRAVDRLYTALNKGQVDEREQTAEDVVQRIIRMRHGDVEVTVGEEVRR